MRRHSDGHNASVRSTTSSTQRHGHGTNGTAPSPQALGVEADIVHVPQETLITIAPERFRGLSGNFGHTQIYTARSSQETSPNFSQKHHLWRASQKTSLGWIDTIVCRTAMPMIWRIESLRRCVICQRDFIED